MSIDEGLKKMKHISELLRFAEKFESFQKSTFIDVAENTQHSIDMTNLNNLTNLTRSSDNFSLGRTKFHNQGESQLCHSFATMSGLRHSLLELVEEKRKNNYPGEKYKMIKNEIITSSGEYSFRMFLINFLGNVNPRSYQGLISSVNPDRSRILRQSAEMKIVIERLVKRTAFEIEGWKRILPVRDIFQELDLVIDDYKLQMTEVNIDTFKVYYRLILA